MKNMKKTVWDVVRDFRQAEKHFKASARAYENNNTARELSQATLGESILAEYGITCDWPGLYPVFKYRGTEQYTLEGVMQKIEANTL